MDRPQSVATMTLHAVNCRLSSAHRCLPTGELLRLAPVHFAPCAPLYAASLRQSYRLLVSDLANLFLDPETPFVDGQLRHTARDVTLAMVLVCAGWTATQNVRELAPGHAAAHQRASHRLHAVATGPDVPPEWQPPRPNTDPSPAPPEFEPPKEPGQPAAYRLHPSTT